MYVRQAVVFSSLFIILFCIKQIDSILPWVCSAEDYRRHQNVVKTSLTHSPLAHVSLLCFYHNVMSSVIYYWAELVRVDLMSGQVCMGGYITIVWTGILTCTRLHAFWLEFLGCFLNFVWSLGFKRIRNKINNTWN